MSILRVNKIVGSPKTNYNITIPSTNKLVVLGTLRTNIIKSLTGSTIWNADTSGNISTSNQITVSGSVTGSVAATGRVELPTWTTSTRPTTNLVNGVVGYNTTIQSVEAYSSGIWRQSNKILDGSSPDKAAISAAGLRNNGVSTNGVYWLTNGGTPYQTYVIFDNVYDSGGWELVYNIDANNATTSIGGLPHWDNTTFWTTINESNQSSTTPWSTNVKTKSFDQRIVQEVLILLHNRSGYNQANCRGWSVYTNSQQTNKTLYTIHTQGNNSIISSGGRKTSSNYVGNLTWNNRRPQSRGGDMFIDGTVNGSNNASDNLIVNSTGYWGSDGVGNTRLSTTAGNGNGSYGHTFGGIGIRHAHAGWGFYVSMAPITAYCEPPAIYGPDGSGTNFTSSPNSGAQLMTQCDGRGWANGFISCGYSVFIR